MLPRVRLVPANLYDMASATARRIAVLVLASFLPVSAGPVWAQPPRSPDLIQRGRDLYEDQRYEESIQTLSGALVRPNMTKDQKIEMYRLLALDHITLGDSEEAESFVRALLALQPDYDLPRTESPKFRDFFAAARSKWEADGRPGLVTEQTMLKTVTLRHRSPMEAEANARLVLTAQVDDPDRRVASVKLFFRQGMSGKFSEETTQYEPTAGAVRAIFPASAIRPPFVAYYMLAKDKNGLPIASSGDADAPLRIPVPDTVNKWVVPVVVAGAIVGIAGIVVGALAAGGAFKGK
jgi:hypothetical protein